MKTNFKFQSGFIDMIIIVLIVALIVAVGVGAYFVGKAKTDQATEGNQSASTSMLDATYTSTLEGASFKYPSDWKLTKGDTGTPSEDKNKFEEIKLLSPNNFELTFKVSAIAGNQGSPDLHPTCAPDCQIWLAESTTIPNYPYGSVKLVEEGDKKDMVNQIGLSGSIASGSANISSDEPEIGAGDVPFWFRSINGAGAAAPGGYHYQYEVWFYGVIIENDTKLPKDYDPKEFDNLPDVKTAKEIFQSLRYP